MKRCKNYIIQAMNIGVDYAISGTSSYTVWNEMNHYDRARKIISSWPQWKQDINLDWDKIFQLQTTKFKTIVNKYKFNYPFGVPNMSELIERLKKNKVPFGLCSKEEQECFKKTGIENCIIYDGEKWVGTSSSNNTTSITLLGFGNYWTFRIKSDYQPKPKIKKYEIVNRDDDLHVDGYSGYGYDNPCIHLCVDDKNFSHFEVDCGYTFQTHLENVAKNLRKGHRVFACFVED